MLDRRRSLIAWAPVVALLCAHAPAEAEASPLSLRARTTTSGATTHAATAAAEGSAVLGLEGDDAEKAKALTAALRKQLAARGKAGARDMTMAELKLTMGCGDTDYACIAEGGKSLAVDELIYGALNGSAPEYMLSLTVLDVGKARVSNGLQTSLSADKLAPGAIDATAEELVTRLLGPASSGAAPAGGGATGGSDDGDGDDDGGGDPVGSDDGGDDDGGDDGGDDSGSGSEEGPEPETDKPKRERGPVPGWKWAGLGISGGLMLGGAGAGVALGIISGPNGSVRDELISEAEASLVDDKPANDVDPDGGGDLCELARAEPPSEPGTVTNASVTQVCNKGEGMALGATISLIGAGVFAASTVVFAILAATHNKKASKTATLQRHQLRVGAAPQRGGMSFGGSFRF
jgi:hypothetical protein